MIFLRAEKVENLPDTFVACRRAVSDMPLNKAWGPSSRAMT